VSDSVGSLSVDISANAASLYAGLSEAADRITRFGKDATSSLDSLTRSFETLGAAVGIGLSVDGLVSFTRGVIETAAQLDRLSIITGSSVESLSQLSNVAQYAGVSFDTVQRLTEKLGAVMGGFGKETSQAQSALKDLGVASQDPVEGLQQLADKLALYADGTTKLAYVQAIFGRGAAQILPLLKDMADAHGIAATTSTEQAAAAAQLEKQIALLEIRTGEFKNAVLSDLVPALLEATSNFNIARAAGLGFFSSLLVSGVDGANIGPLIDKVRGQITGLQSSLDEAKKKNVESPYIFGPGVQKDITDTTAQLDAATTRLKIFEQIQAQAILSRPGLTGPATFDARDYQALKLPTLPTLAPAGGVDEYAKALQNVREMAAEADAQLKALTDGTGQLTAAQTALARLEASDVWKTFNATQKATLETMFGTVSAAQQQVAALTAAVNAGKAFSDSMDKLVAGFDSEKSKSDAAAVSLLAFGTASHDTQAAALDLFLSTDKTQAALVAMDLVLPGISDALTAIARAHAAAADASKVNEDATKAYVDQVKNANNALQDYYKSVDQDAQKLDDQARELGLTKAQIDQYRLSQDEATLSLLQGQLALASFIGTNPAYIAALDADVAAQQHLVDAQKNLAGAQAADDVRKAWGGVFDTLTNDASTFFQDFEKNGSSAFKTLADNLVSQLVGALAKLAAQQFILSITANTSLAGAAQQAVGSAGGNLLTGSPGGSLLNNAPTLLGLPSFSTAVGNLGTILPTFSASLESGAGVIESASAAFAGTAASFATVGIPILGAALLAYGLISGNKQPTPVSGQFAISPGTTGFEDNAYTHTSLGNLNLGFADANTQEFSGQAAQVFNKIVSGALDAFQTRFSPEQSSRLATILQGTTFATESGTFTTQDFLQKYGGQVLQQVVTAAFNVLDPALGSVAANFKGTADEVSTFSNSLLGIFDATKQIGNVDFTAKVDAALADATQATADKVLALVTIVSQLGDSITGLGPKIEALDPAQMTAFVDALGGAQTALQTMGYISANFSTAADKVNAAQALLNSDFANLGLAVPATHSAFLSLLNSFDLTTDAGRTMYASVSALAPLFVQVAGTADQAAAAFANIVSSIHNTLQGLSGVTGAAADTANRNALIDQFVSEAGHEWAKTLLGSLGYQGFTTNLESIDTSPGGDLSRYTPADQTLIGNILSEQLAIQNAQSATTAGASSGLSGSSSGPVKPAYTGPTFDSVMSQIAAVTAQSTDFGTTLSTQFALLGDAIVKAKAQLRATPSPEASLLLGNLTHENSLIATEIAHYAVYTAQYDATRAEALVNLEEWYDAQKTIFAGMPASLAALQGVFDEKWTAIVNGVSSGVSGALDQMARLQQGIADYLKGLQVGSLSPLTPSQQFNAAQNAFLDELAKAQPSNTDTESRQAALGDITQLADAFLKQAQSFDPSNYLNVFKEVTQDLAPLAGTGPNGLPLPTTTSATAAIASALPTNSKLASADDIAAATKALQATLQQVMTAVANAATKDAQVQANATTTAANLLVASSPQR